MTWHSPGACSHCDCLRRLVRELKALADREPITLAQLTTLLEDGRKQWPTL
jgi:hypothetical protein